MRHVEKIAEVRGILSERFVLVVPLEELWTLLDTDDLLRGPRDIAENPNNINVRELEAATLPRVLTQVDLALINTNYALEAQLKPTEDALILEGSDSPYVNILVARPDNKDSEAMRKLAKALNSEPVKAFIAEKYQGAVVPAF